nr:acyl carrier protein [Streptomyces chartreusis]
MRIPEPVLVPIPLDLAAVTDSAAPAVLADLLPTTSRPGEAAEPVAAVAQAPGAWRERLASVAPHERETALAELIRVEVAAVLGFPDPAALPTERPFTELGFDSLTAVQVRNRISAFTRVRLAPTVVLEYPTPSELAAHVHAALLDAGALPPVGSAEPEGAEGADSPDALAEPNTPCRRTASALSTTKYCAKRGRWRRWPCVTSRPTPFRPSPTATTPATRPRRSGSPRATARRSPTSPTT